MNGKNLHIPGDDPSKQECQHASSLIQVHKNKIPTVFMLENSPKLHLEDYVCETASILEKEEELTTQTLNC